MLRTPVRLGTQAATLACLFQLAALRPAFAAGAPRGIEALQASTPTVRVGNGGPEGIAIRNPETADDRGCAAPALPRCFDPASGPVTGRFLNVGSFFDEERPPGGPRRRTQYPRSSSSHYFLKYFDPGERTDTLQVHGIQFFGSTTTREVLFPSAGVLATDRSEPHFPTTDQLADLQRRRIPLSGSNTSVCVDLTSANILLPPDKAGWVVLQFPDVADSVFAGVLVDRTGADQPCDFLTPDGGRLWFRPDPASAPPLDWAITVHAAARQRKAKRDVPWFTMKRFYR